jgi:hypothetical protein
LSPPKTAFGGDVVGKKTAFTQDVETFEVETDNLPEFFNILLGRGVSAFV